MPDLAIPQGITEIPSSPSNVTHADAVETPAAPSLTPIQPTPEEKAAYESQFGPPPLNPIRDFSAQELADLSVQDKDHFDIVSAFRAQPDLHADPAIVQKAADALNLVKQRGFKLSDLPSPGQAAAGVLHSAKGFGKQLWNYANVGADVIGAAVTSPFSTDVAETFAKDVDKRLSSNIAGTEEGMAGIADIGRKIIGKAGRLTGISKDFSQYTPEEKKNDLWAEVGRHEVQQERLQGKGPFTAAVTGGVAGEQNLNPEEISTLAAGDPVSFFAFGKGMEGAGALVPGVVKNAAGAAAAKIGEAATQVVPKAAGKTVEGVAQAMKTGGELVQPIGKILSVAGPVVGAAAKLTGADTLASVGGGILGGTAGVALKRAGQVSVEWSRGVKDFGKQIAGSAPIKSAYAQAGKDFLQTLPSATGAIAKGAAIDLGLAAVTAETPQETEGMATFGTALGALHGAGRMAGHMISGQIIAPREYGIKTVTPSSGQFKALDAMHNEAVRDAAPGVKARLNAIREFLSGTESGTDAFLGKDSASVEKALTESGVDPATAKAWSSQEGFFTADLKGQDGSPRRVVVMRNVEAAPHESFHVIQDVLGESANREIDKIVREAYADRWDHEGETYAKRLVGSLGDKTWQETILDASGWGLDEAKEKLYFDIANSAREHGAGKELPPGAIDAQVKETLGKIMDAAVLRNPHIDPKELARHVWRDVLSPEEANAVADKYIARELAAENFDAAFKAGKTQPPNTTLPAKLGRVAGRLISALGGEPLADRQSEIGQVPLKTPVVEAVTEAAKAKGGIVVAKSKGKPVVPTKPPSGPTEPTKPEEEQAKNGEEAKAIADEAPTAPQPGGTKSPRELLGQIAESISKGEGIKINYLSAPDEPAAATTSNRETRRAIIEAFRTMPPEARALWEKTFFPDRVVKTKTGYQVLGWAPEVFAANAHKMAAFLADHTALSPYEIDATTKTFTPSGWKELYSDVQKFVQNQKVGTTGSGEPLVVPKGVSDRGFTAPARRGGEVAIDQTKADFINLLFNFKLPETPRQTKGKMPLNLAGQEVSEATMPGRVEVPVRPRGEYKDEFAGRAIQEVNPLRNQVEAAAKSAGVEVPSLIEAVQRLNLENIKEVESAPEAPEFRGNTLTLTAGFQPGKLELPPRELADKVDKMSVSEFRAWAAEADKNGGFTPIAHEVGLQAPDEAFVQHLRDRYADLSKKAMDGFKDNPDDGFAKMAQAQFFREAFEAADGTSSGGFYLRKKLGDAYKPPFPAGGGEPKAQFAPKGLPYEEQKKVIDEIRGSEALKIGAGHIKYGEDGLRLSIKLREGVQDKLSEILRPLGLEFKTDEPITDKSYTVVGTILKSGDEPNATKVQFNPNEPDAVKRAAVRVKGTDDVFTGETHGEAWRNSKQPDAKFDYGFVTNSGEFLDRKQAWKRAKEMGQIEGDEWTPKPGELESVVFENANARAKYGFKGQAQPKMEKLKGTEDLNKEFLNFYEMGNPKVRFDTLIDEYLDTRSEEYLQGPVKTEYLNTRWGKNHPEASNESLRRWLKDTLETEFLAAGVPTHPEFLNDMVRENPDLSFYARSQSNSVGNNRLSHIFARLTAEGIHPDEAKDILTDARLRKLYSPGLPVNLSKYLQKHVGTDFKGQAQPAARLTDEEASKIAGSSVHRPEPTYKAASEKEGNPWVRNSKDPSHNADPSNEKRTLMVQFDTHLQSFGGKITRDEASAYYDKLYSGKREGYSRMADFWEIPQWMGFAAHLFGDSDVYVVRDMAQAKKFLNEAKYGKVIFSSMDVNRELIRDLAKDYDGTLDVGGYVDPKYFSDIPNVKWNDSLKTLADNAGVNYSEGVDYRHFVGSDSLPRLTLSSGCKFKCAFCTIEKVVKTAPEELVKQQAEEIAKLGTKLVYLNDKTFGQAPNYQMLSELNTMMKEKNPNFQGFVVQTTASQMVKLPKDWLAKSGIKFVELGIESYNDPILRSVRKPATEGLMDESTQALREAGITLIPNVLIGLPGETAETYARTLDFLKRNSDIISHANIYNLAVYKDTEMAKRITTASPGDYDENVREKTFYTDPEVHRVFAGDLYKMGEEFLDKVPKTAAQPSQGQPEAGVERLSDVDDMWPGGYAAINEQRRQVEAGEVAGKEELGAEALQGNREDRAGQEATAQFAPRKPQDKDWKLISNNSESKKAWILPDGTPEQLGGMWHHQWLSEDPDGMRAAKKYGVETTPFEGVDDDTTRQSALRKGFARVNYDNNSGRLVVEVLASRYNKLRDAIDQLAEANIKDIDKMTVNLLNHTMDAIVDSDSKSLIRYDTTKEKLANLPFSDRDPRLTQARKVAENPVFSTPETNEVLPSAYQGEPEYQVFDGTGKFIGRRDKYGHAEELLKQTGSGVIKSVRTFKNQAQPQGEQQDVLPGIESGKEYVGNAAVANMTSEELRNHFPEAIVPSPRDLEIPSAITKSPLYKEAGSESKAVQAFADKLVSFANEFKDDPSFKAGSEWYSKFSPQLKKAFGKDAQIFAELLAATSPQTAAAVNFSYAFDALKSLRSGRFDKIIPKFNQGLDMIADDKWVPWYNKELKAGGIPKPPAQPTPAAFLEAWIHKHDLKPRQSNGALYGTHSIPVLQVFARKWLTESRGPKTLNFVKNLVGDGHEATIDLWADRTMRRMGYADHKERWRILPGNGTGVAPEDFAFGQKAFRAAADKLKMKPDALQGALWFAEKKLWANKGWGKLDLGDFSTEMEKMPMLESGFKQRTEVAKKKTKKEEPLDLFVEPRKLK